MIASPLVLGLGIPELLIILAVVLLLFGGARLAGLGKSTGRAIKEFKEETRGIRANDDQVETQPPAAAPAPPAPPATTYQPPPQDSTSDSTPSDPR
jgi:sec-independent protein translocase protein TatA